jgi:thiamine-phosphate pyrophosphorylase
MGAGSFQARPAMATADQALRGGVDVLQLRDYALKDSELLAAALELREMTRKFGTLFIVNNRPDIAVLSGADGVHVGQDDLSVADARKILGKGKIVGVSTHAPEQARKAFADGADYIGVGPVFATPTKAGRQPVTVEYVRQVAEMNPPIPFFAIGGIDLSNIHHVIESGAGRIAVVRAIAEASDPQKAAADFKKSLENHPLASARS